MSNPNFSSGPCSKRPGWNLDVLKDGALGRSHRSALGKGKLEKAIRESKRVLGLPEDYLLGILPGSDTGTFEGALWSLLGPKPVTVLVWESFSEGWATDIAEQLKLNPAILRADYGKIPDLRGIDWSNDVVFVANGTTSGVRIPNWDWIPEKREGLTICDATSAVFAMDIDWEKVDVLTYSWQKCLGGEAAHGVLILSPRAVERIETYDPSWPMPKIFRLKKGNKLNRGIFEGSTINTPSMLCVEDYLDALEWADGIGLTGLIERSESNLRVIEEWVSRTNWIDFLADSEEIRSHTSVCLIITADAFKAMPREEQSKFIKDIAGTLSRENIAHDTGSYKEAPPGFRFWCGPTVEAADLTRALEGLEKIYLEKTKDL
ncbi:MAG: phosphoserine transaminase [Thermodesulfobacteriota bacterium]|nr:phosphoserine transaminase [Thermodesulfobacteriota bacterium]